MPVFAVFRNVIFLQYINQFGECGSNEYAGFIFYAVDSLPKRFFYYKRKVVARSSLGDFIQIHKYGYKRRLSVCRHQRNNLILNHLYAAVNFLQHSRFRYFIELLFI